MNTLVDLRYVIQCDKNAFVALRGLAYVSLCCCSIWIVIAALLLVQQCMDTDFDMTTLPLFNFSNLVLANYEFHMKPKVWLVNNSD